MNRRYLIVLQLVILLGFGQNAFALNVLVTQSTGAYTMPTRWQSVLTGMGHTVNIQPISVLDNNSFFATTNVLIISDGTASYTSTQINTIQAFIQSGKPVYLQTEYQNTYGGNTAWAQIVNALGGSFTWGATQTNDQNPNIFGSFTTTNNAVSALPYFWYGCTGTGGSNVFTFVKSTPDDVPLGWSFCPPNGSYGKVITTSDQDWIQNIGTYPIGADLMENIFTHLITANLCGPAGPSGTITAQANVRCNGGNNGSATISASGGTAPYTYSWSPSGGAGASISGRTAGTYTCTIRDANGLTGTVTVTITEPAALSSTGTQNDVTCNGGNNGSATVTVSGGTPPYTYSWSPSGGAAATASSLTANTYTVTYRDFNNCSNTRSFTIGQPAAFTPTIASSANPSTCGGTNGGITLSGFAAGTTYQVTYNKDGAPVGAVGIASNGSGVLVINNLGAGVYTNIVAALSGCSSSAAGPVTLTDPSTPATPVISTNSPVCSGGTLNLTGPSVSGATYSWTGPNGFTSALQSPSVIAATTGTYSLYITVGGCNSATATASVIVNSSVTPSVSVAANPGSTICAGTNVTFTATPVNGGATPAYQWRKNGTNVGTNSATYADNALTTGDVITVRLTSNAICRTLDTVNSAGTTMTVNASLVPSVTVSANPGTTICTGTNVTFTATPVNGGATPAYQWRKNGMNVGTNSATYADNGLANGDVVTVRLTSNAACRSVDTTNSTGVTMSVNAVQNISVSAAANPGSTICAGTNVTFTATPVNGGGTPVYQWRKNGTNVGTNSVNYSDNTLVNGDKITVRLTSDATCRNADTTNSTAITMSVNPLLVPSVSIAANPGASVCAGTNVTFTATPVNGGATPAYQWRKNGMNVGTNSAIYADNALTTGDVITVRLTSNATCRTLDTANSAGTTMTVTTVPAQPGAITGNTKVCGGTAQLYSIAAVTGATSYTWTLPSGWSGTSTTTSINATAATATGTGVISVTANNSCGSSTARTLADTVGNTPARPGTISGNPALCSGASQVYTITPVPEAASYTWTLPSGWSGTSTAANINATAPAATGTGNITVTATNFCGTSAAGTLPVSVTNAPATPGTITGNPSVCAGTAQAYGIAAVPEATAYTWSLPAGGWTGSSTTNTINTTASTISGAGTITVTARNFCGTSAASTFAVSVTNIPAAPGAITGSASVCGGTAQQYSIVAVNEATSYAWTVPGGWTPNGQTTAAFLNTTVGTSSGNITVTAGNFCGNSAPRTLAVNVINIPAQPAAITGNVNVCGGTAQPYSVPAVSQATSYNWTIPQNGWTATGATGTSVVRSTPDVATIAGTAGGTILLTASNVCGTSPSRSINVNVTNIPAMPAPVNGPDSLCAGAGVSFSIGYVNEATSYSWTLPPLAGWTGNSTGLVLNTGSNAAGPAGPVILSVAAVNGCGASAPRTKAIKVIMPVVPQVNITGTNTTICSGMPVTFTAVSANGGSAPLYQWRINGLNYGNATPIPALTTTDLNNGDIVSVVVNSNAACATPAYATSNTITAQVTQTVTPGVNLNANQPQFNICDGQPVTFAATPVTGAGYAPQYQWYKNQLPVGGNAATYTDASPLDNDTVQVVMISSASCVTVPSAASNKVRLRVWPVLAPSVTISASPGVVVHAGTPVTFTAHITNGGANPHLQWMKNGQGIPSANALTYTTNTLKNGDVINLQLSADLTCASPGVVMSMNTLAMVIQGTTGTGTAGTFAADIKLYPSPNTGRFTLQVSGGPAGKQVQVDVLGMLGQVVHHTAVTPDRKDWSMDIDLGAAAAGIYLLRVSGEDRSDVIVKRFEVIR